jgi:hypothetical protein
MSGKYGIPEGRLKIWLRRQEGQLYKYVPFSINKI